MDMFVQQTESSTPTNGCGVEYCPPGIVMDYYDGNTVTGLWNYAQYYSMSDNNWDTSFGPSTPGAVNVTSGNTSGAEALNPAWDTTGAGAADDVELGHRHQRQDRPRHALRRRGPVLRRLLRRQPRHRRRPGRADRREHRRPAEHQERLLGLVRGRLRADRHVRRARLHPGPAGLRLRAREHRRSHHADQRLRAAPRAVPVLRVDREPGPPAAGLAVRHRLHRPGQPPVRHLGLLRRPERHRRRQAAGRELPEGAGLRGRPPGLLRPARRADLPGQHHQLDREVQVLAVDRDRHHLRRLGRLVRPPGAGHHQRVQRRHQHRRPPRPALTTPRCAPRSR